MKPFQFAPRLWLAATVLALFTTACQDSPTEPMYSLEPSYASAAMGTLEIVSPTNGATLSGVNEVKARLTDRPSTSYTMFWQVDGGARTLMTEIGGYHVANVDVSTWTWKGTGPYTISFIAEQKVRGKAVLVGSSSVQVSVGVTAPPPPATITGNVFAGANFYLDPYSNAKRIADGWRATRPLDAAEMDKIASRAQADWFGAWNGDIYQAVQARVTTITNAGALPVLVAYNIPSLDCASGGAASADAYRTWITNFANGIGQRKAVVVLEPDALAALGCLSLTGQQSRLELLKFAVQTLKAKGGIAVYIDAGHARWQSTSIVISRLNSAGIDQADGFSLNVSNYIANSESRTYGEQVSAGVAGKHFIIDTSRNGQGSNGDWCNAIGRGLGVGATANTGAPLIDAFYWIKRPGESDGNCNGGPTAGAWWAESGIADEAHALGLAKRAVTVLASN